MNDTEIRDFIANRMREAIGMEQARYTREWEEKLINGTGDIEPLGLLSVHRRGELRSIREAVFGTPAKTEQTVAFGGSRAQRRKAAREYARQGGDSAARSKARSRVSHAATGAAE